MARAAWCIVAVLLVVAAGLVSAQGSGGGLGVSPPRIDVAGAQPSQTYVRTVQVQNPSDTPSGIGIQRSGEVADWTTTNPAGNFTIPAHGVRDVALSIVVPGSAGPGSHKGQLTFIADPKQGPSGSGSTIRPAIGLLLNVTVGGEAITKFTWLSARVEDARVGSSVHAFVTARNDGNVRAAAEASGAVMPFDEDAPLLSNATGSLILQPGEQGEVPVTFPSGLAIGQYRARLRSPAADGFEQTLPFKVTAGGAAPDGVLRAIVHVPFGTSGRPVRLEAWFENTGNITIGAASFKGEVTRDGELLATLESDTLVVDAGHQVNLTAYWTPPRSGTYLVSGHVTYDGYQTLPSETVLNVKAGGAALGIPWWLILLVLVILMAIGIMWAVLRRRVRRKGKGPAR